MSHTDMVFLSGLLWLVVGFFIGRHHHALQVREIVARRIAQQLRDREVDRLIAKVAVACLETPSDARVN